MHDSLPSLEAKLPFIETIRISGRVVFQKLLVAEANRWVRMCNLQSAKNCASVKTSLATVHARAQEMGKEEWFRPGLYSGTSRTDQL